MHFRAQIAHAHEMGFSFFHSVTKELKQAPFFEPQTESESECFACQDSGLSQISKLIVPTCEKILDNINLAE